jgi:hypothetical protein
MENAESIKDQGFDYSLIRDKLLSIIEATANKLEREWPQRYSAVDSARIFFVVTIRIAINTYKTITYICADLPEDFRRDKKFSLSIPALNRTILENIMTLLFVLEDMQQRMEWFYKSGYREWKEALGRYKRDYGLYPEWQDFINHLKAFVINPPGFIGLTSAEIADTDKRIEYWPNPGKMPKYIRQKRPASATTDHLRFLNDWFYKALSGQSHLSLHGFAERGKFFTKEVMINTFGENADAVMEKDLERFRNDQIWLSIILMLALASEMEMHFRIGLDQRLIYLWTLIVGCNDQAKDLYDRRYKIL